MNAVFAHVMASVHEHILNLPAACNSFAGCPRLPAVPLAPPVSLSRPSGRGRRLQRGCKGFVRFSFHGGAAALPQRPRSRCDVMGYPVTAESTGHEINYTLAWAWEHVGCVFKKHTWLFSCQTWFLALLRSQLECRSAFRYCASA